MSRARKAVIATSITVVVIAALCFGPPNKNSVSYHLNCMRSLDRSWPGPLSGTWSGPPSLRFYLYPRVWSWYLRGRPSLEQSLSQKDEHRQALVKLGYFEKRDFTLARRTLDPSGKAEFNSLLTNAPFSDKHHWVWAVADDRPSVVTVTALRADMPVWSNIVSRFDSRKTQ